jgi:hypothetical protein
MVFGSAKIIVIDDEKYRRVYGRRRPQIKKS